MLFPAHPPPLPSAGVSTQQQQQHMASAHRGSQCLLLAAQHTHARTQARDKPRAATSMASGDLFGLPSELTHEIAVLLPPASICQLEGVNHMCRALLHGNKLLWREVAEKRWGALAADDGHDWRGTLVWLETDVRAALSQSVRGAFKLMEASGLLGEGKLAWKGCVHRLLDWVTLVERRRLAAFVCADWQPRDAAQLSRTVRHQGADARGGAPPAALPLPLPADRRGIGRRSGHWRVCSPVCPLQPCRRA